MLRDGRGATEDRALGAGFLAKAAAQGHADAMNEYAIALFNGDGVNKSEDGAAKLFLKAAHKGHAIAMNRVARLYAAGRGVKGDNIEAAAWHLTARKLGSSDQMLDDVLNGLTGEERAKAETRAQVLRGSGASAALDAPAAKAQ